ncbi:MAG TPA: LytTR family DNA-binding domain-containing protein [Terrimicrobiaceae bacterium]
MKAKIVRKGFDSAEEPHDPVEEAPLTLQNGTQADPGHVLYELKGETPLNNDDFVVLTDNIKCCILRMSDLLRLEAEGNYSRVYWIGSSMLIRRPLRECEKRLDKSKFFRARRDCIVNLEHVKHTRIVDLMRYVFVLQDGTEVTLSRRQSLVLRKSRAL